MKKIIFLLALVVSAFGQQQQLRVVDTVAQLKELPPSAAMSSVIVKGRDSAGDGGGGVFIWQPADSTAEDGGTVFQSTRTSLGRWNRSMDTRHVDAMWFGAKRDGVTDDTAAIQSAMNAAVARGFELNISGGTFLVSRQGTVTIGAFSNRGYVFEPVTGATGIRIKGDGKFLLSSENASEANVFTFLQCTNVVVDGLSQEGFWSTPPPSLILASGYLAVFFEGRANIVKNVYSEKRGGVAFGYREDGSRIEDSISWLNGMRFRGAHFTFFEGRNNMISRVTAYEGTHDGDINLYGTGWNNSIVDSRALNVPMGSALVITNIPSDRLVAQGILIDSAQFGSSIVNCHAYGYIYGFDIKTTSTGSRVIGNTARDNEVGIAVRVGEGDSQAFGTTIQGNTIFPGIGNGRTAALYGTTNAIGILLDNTIGANVSGNWIGHHPSNPSGYENPIEADWIGIMIWQHGEDGSEVYSGSPSVNIANNDIIMVSDYAGFFRYSRSAAIWKVEHESVRGYGINISDNYVKGYAGTRLQPLIDIHDAAEVKISGNHLLHGGTGGAVRLKDVMRGTVSGNVTVSAEPHYSLISSTNVTLSANTMHWIKENNGSFIRLDGTERVYIHNNETFPREDTIQDGPIILAVDDAGPNTRVRVDGNIISPRVTPGWTNWISWEGETDWREASELNVLDVGLNRVHTNLFTGAFSAESISGNVANVYNVNRYGADPTGVSNSTAAFIAAVAAAPPGSEVYMPEGRFLLDLNSVWIRKPLTLSGAGRGTVLIPSESVTATGNYGYVTNGAMINVNRRTDWSSVKDFTDLADLNWEGQNYNVELRDFRINGAGRSRHAAGIYAAHTGRMLIDNVYIEDLDGPGLVLRGLREPVISRVYISASGAWRTTGNRVKFASIEIAPYEGEADTESMNMARFTDCEILYPFTWDIVIRDHGLGAGQNADVREILFKGNNFHGLNVEPGFGDITGTDGAADETAGTAWRTYKTLIYPRYGYSIADFNTWKNQYTQDSVLVDGFTKNITFAFNNFHGARPGASFIKFVSTQGGRVQGNDFTGYLDNVASSNRYAIFFGFNSNYGTYLQSGNNFSTPTSGADSVRPYYVQTSAVVSGHNRYFNDAEPLSDSTSASIVSWDASMRRDKMKIGGTFDVNYFGLQFATNFPSAARNADIVFDDSETRPEFKLRLDAKWNPIALANRLNPSAYDYSAAPLAGDASYSGTLGTWRLYDGNNSAFKLPGQVGGSVGFLTNLVSDFNYPGFTLYSTDLQEYLTRDGDTWRKGPRRAIGPTANRPTGYKSIGYRYFDQDLGSVVEWTGSEWAAPATQPGQWLNSSVITGQIQTDLSESANVTRFFLYDVQTSSLQRVKVGANGTGPGGTGRALYIDNTP